MSEGSFLLSVTPTAEHRISMEENTAVLEKTTRFVLDGEDMKTLIWFLEAAKADRKERHTFTGYDWTLDYDPERESILASFKIYKHSTGRTISMARATAWKLLDALTGNTERLIKQEPKE